MAQRVGIVSVAQTKFSSNRADVDLAELVYESVEKVLAETGLKFTEDGTGIDGTVSCSQDLWDGRTISSQNAMDVSGGHLRPEEKVAEDGIMAVYYAFLQILSGHYDTVLVVGHCKESQTDGRIIENQSVDPIFLRLLGMDFLAGAALQADCYMGKFGISAEQCAKVAVKNRKNAKLNPFAQAPADLTVNDVLKSEILAYPIRQLDAKPVSDGSCALIIATEEKAKKLCSKPVWIKGIANCYDAHNLGDRDLSEAISLKLAAQRAYKMAGITRPLSEIDVAEISEEYSYQELLWSEGLGFCDRGEGGKLIDSGITELSGSLPINPSGGVISGNPASVAGMARVVETVLQLRGEADKRQVEKARVALAHGMSGICGQLQCVAILEKGE